MRMEQEPLPTGVKFSITIVVLIILLLLGLWLLPFTSVNAGHKGIVLRGGKVVRVLDEGYSYKAPIIEDVEEVDVRTQVEKAKASAASKDLQTVTTEVAVNFNVRTDRVASMWNSVGKEYKSVIIDPAIQEIVKSATAKHTAEELVTKRQVVKDEITETLKARLSESGFLVVTQVSLTDFDYSAAFNQAIEAKVTAEQNALASKNKLEQVKYEAQQQVEKAKAEAESIRIQAQAITQQGGRDYVQLKALEKWDGKLPSQMIPGGTVPFIDLNK